MFGDAGHAGIFLDDAFDGAGSKTAEIARSVDGALVFAIVKKSGVRESVRRSR